jgi:hypothetical protein
MFKSTITTLSAVLVTVICFQGNVEASGKGTKTGSSSSSRTVSTNSFNTSRFSANNVNINNVNVNNVNINNTGINKSNFSSTTFKSSNLSTKTTSTTMSLKSTKTLSSSCVVHGSCCGWWGSWFGCCSPGYCYGYCGWYRPYYWWCCDYTPLVIVEPTDGQPATGPAPTGDANSNPPQALEPTPPAKIAPGGM